MTPEERRIPTHKVRSSSVRPACLGHLRAYLDAHGSAFCSCWEDHDPELETDRFTKEFNTVVDMLRLTPRKGEHIKKYDPKENTATKIGRVRVSTQEKKWSYL